MSTVIEIVLGAVIAIGLTILIEVYRKPKLLLEIEKPPVDLSWDEPKPAQKLRSLRLVLRNKNLPFLFRWMSRNAALQAHGMITFHHLDGQKIFDRSMKLRWGNSPQPIPNILHIEGSRDIVISIHHADFHVSASSNETTRRDIYPGDGEVLDVAVRLDDEDECYGWNDDSYHHNWRNPDWKIPLGRYLVKVTITSAGEKVTGVFRLINDVPVKDFRLDLATREDIRKIRD